MPAAWLLKNLFATLLLPPANGLLLLALAGLFRRRRWAAGLATVGALLLLIQSLPPVAGWLTGTLEERAGPALADPGAAEAIVILGGGLTDAAEYSGGVTLNPRSLARARYGAVLARRYSLPVLVSGGVPVNARRSEAEVIGEALENEFGIEVRWRENRSLDTADNAALSAELLREAGIQRIILVTQAFHMPRARRLFTETGLEVTPAPTELGQRSIWPEHFLDWLPQINALHATHYALHEWLGIAWLDLQALLHRARSDS
ncbi:MAG: YdcF family protein [Desulfobulbus sp.]|nr:YdcF family protein [Desulfobulbus sp.]